MVDDLELDKEIHYTDPMWKKKYKTTQELYDGLSREHQQIVDRLREIFTKHGGEEVLQRNCLVYKFPNGSYRYLNSYQKETLVLWSGQANQAIKANPMIAGLFDEQGKVVGKIYLYSLETIDDKGLPALVDMISLLEL